MSSRIDMCVSVWAWDWKIFKTTTPFYSFLLYHTLFLYLLISHCFCSWSLLILFFYYSFSSPHPPFLLLLLLSISFYIFFFVIILFNYLLASTLLRLSLLSLYIAFNDKIALPSSFIYWFTILLISSLYRKGNYSNY